MPTDTDTVLSHHRPPDSHAVIFPFQAEDYNILHQI